MKRTHFEQLRKVIRIPHARTLIRPAPDASQDFRVTEHDNWRRWDKHRDCRGPHKGLHGWCKGQYEDLPTDDLPDEDHDR